MRRTFICLVTSMGLCFPAAAAAETIVVNTTEDAAATGKCTFRAAIEASNANSAKDGCVAGSGTDRIEFALPDPSTITLASTLPAVSGAVEIAGPGAAVLTISGKHEFQVLKVTAPSTISNLTIADGRSFGGGGIHNQASALELIGVTIRGNEARVEGGTSAFATGGGIYNQGGLKLVGSTVAENVSKSINATLQNAPEGGGIANPVGSGSVVLERSTVRDNSVIAISAGTATSNANGGGLSNSGELTLIDSTVSGNEASGSGSTAANRGSGGGISNANSANVKVTIVRSTIVDNAASAASPISSVGPGGLVVNGSSFQVVGSTIAGNAAPLGGANVALGVVAHFRSTIVARPIGGASCVGAATSEGFNLDEGTSCGFNEPTDQHGVDPLLAPGLAANGGPTETLALLHGSPAIDRGLSTAGETSDQRGSKRPVDIPSVPNAPGGDGADVGAYEVQVPHASIVHGPGEGGIIADPEPTFEFVADEAGATFLCGLDGSLPAPCASPFKLPRLADGQHVFTVAAVGGTGYAEEPPKARAFTVDTRVPEPKPETPSSSPPGGQPLAPPLVAPRTTISGLPAKTTKQRLSIRFSSDQAGSTFLCKLDGRKWRNCRSPFKTPDLTPGKHTFRVKATGPTGVANPTATKKTFRVVAPPPS